MITCIIVDDEPHSVELLQIYARRMPQLQVLATFNNPLLAEAAMKTQLPQLVFIDQQMPNMTGTEFIQQHRGSARFVLTTAYTDIDIAGLENDIIDYLVKPFPFAKFEAAVQKAVELLTVQHCP